MRNRRSKKNRFLSFLYTAFDYLTLVFAGALYALAFKYFVFPAKVILTGTEGISAALAYYFDSQWLFVVLYAVFQAILLGFAFLKISKRFAVRTFLTVGTVVCLLPCFPDFRFAQPEPQNERILLAIFGGLLAGIAKTIAFRNRGSTGDEDVLGAYFAQKYLKPVGSIAVIAAVISTAFGMALDLLRSHQFESAVNTLMYTGIYIFVSAETLNNFFRKFKLSLITVVTQCPDPVFAAIRSVAENRTCTIEEGVGGYSKQRKYIVTTVVTYDELSDVIDAIKQSDPNGFFYRQDIEGVSGRYYISPIG